MITDIPTGSDFQVAASNLLNLAWDSTINLCVERFDQSDWDSASVMSDEYWKAAQPILTSSLSLIQQSVEFFLKGKIAEISPYLLIIGNPSSWPSTSHKTDTSFADFRTIDAQDLIKVHDTVTARHLPEPFHQWFNEFRKTRNRLMHTVAKSTRLSDKDVILAILEACEYCVGSKSWLTTRENYLRNTPIEHLMDEISQITDSKMKDAYRLGQLQREIMTVIEYIEPRYSKQFFGFDKKKKRYLCLHCLSKRQNELYFEYKDIEELYLHTAHLVDASSKTLEDSVYCMFCDSFYHVKHEKCNNEDFECDGDLIDAHNNLCLSCTYEVRSNVELQPGSHLPLE